VGSAAFQAIEARGGQVERTKGLRDASLRLGGVVFATTAARATTYVITLPRPATPRFVFSRESLRSALEKLVWGDLVFGDPAFDDVVCARTDTPEATRALLHDAELRAFVTRAVGADGLVSLDGDRVTVRLPEEAGLGEADVAAFVERIWP
jgi:hypothetical protein